MRKFLPLFVFFSLSLKVYGQTIFINEIHYDNSGVDVNEGIEIAGPAGTNLACYQLVAYNGADNLSYMTNNLSGVIPNQCNGYGTLWFTMAGLQNGAPDGIALYNSCTTTLIQFLSWEGSFTAGNGPASGIGSTNIVVDEEPAPASGTSLQLTGLGTVYPNFTWTGPVTSTTGSVNGGQDFGCAIPVATEFRFTSIPGNCTNINTNFSTTVCATDNKGNIATTYVGSATVSKNSGPGVLSGTTTLALTNGCATFSNLKFNTAGNYTLLASNGTLTNAISGNIVISDSCEKCLEINSILVDACGGLTEGLQEMVQFEAGDVPLDVNNLTVTWPNNPYLGICQNANTAAFVANTNATITGGGTLVQPPGGIIPADARVLLITSDGLVNSAMDFSNLNYTLYVIFQCAGNTAGHFKNYCSTPCGDRTLTLDFGSGCVDSVKYEPNLLLNQAGSPGDQDGAVVNFTTSGQPTYGNNGCVAPFAPPLTATVSGTNPACNGGTNGSATATPVGGTALFTYSWSTGATTSTVSFLSAGSYWVIIEDDYFFKDTAYITLTTPPVLTITNSVTHVVCPCEATGSINITPSGGTPGYTFSWNTGATTEDISGLTGSTYTVTVTDTKSCTMTSSITINEPPPIVITLVSQNNIPCMGQSNGQITVQASGGTAPYDFSIDGGSTYTFNNITALTSVTFNLLPAGVYSIKIRDGNNCITSP